MLHRVLIVLALCGLLGAAAGSAQAPKDLLFHQRTVAGIEMTQLAVILPVPPAPPGSAQRPEMADVPAAALPFAVAAVDYLAERGYLENGSYGVEVSRLDSGWAIHVSLPGADTDIWVHAPGPFFPVPTDDVSRALTSVLVLDVSNGF